MGATGDINTQYASRLYDANEANPSAENGSFTDWSLDAEFILCVVVNYYDPCNKATDGEQVKIQFSEDGGAWTDVAAGQAIAPGSSTTLVNGANVTQRITTNVPSAYCGSGFSSVGVEVEGTGTANAFTIASENWTEVHFALDPALANAGSEYTFRLYNVTVGTAFPYGTISSSLTVAAVPATQLVHTDSGEDYCLFSDNDGSAITITQIYIVQTAECYSLLDDNDGNPINITQSHNLDIQESYHLLDDNNGFNIIITTGTNELLANLDSYHLHYIDSIWVAEGNDFANDLNCVAWWKLDNGALTTDSQGGNLLTNVGTVTSDTSNKKQGDGSALFDGSNYFKIGDVDLDSDFPFKNGFAEQKMSVCFWARASQTANSKNLISKWDFAGNKCQWVLKQNPSYIGNSIRVQFSSTGAGGFYIDDEFSGDGYLWEPGVWFHITHIVDNKALTYRTLMYDDSTGILWDSGVKDFSLIQEGTIFDANAAFCIGAIEDASNNFEGNIDDVVVFKNCISVEEAVLIRRGLYVKTKLEIDNAYHLHDGEGSLSLSQLQNLSVQDSDNFHYTDDISTLSIVAWEGGDLISEGTSEVAKNYRVIITAEELDYGASDGFVRLKLLAPPTQAITISGASIGQRKAVDDSFDYDISAVVNVRFTFNGNNTVEIPAGQTTWSDWVPFAVDQTKDHLVHIYINAGHKYPYRTDAQSYSSTAGNDQTMLADVKGYSLISEFLFVVRMEVRARASMVVQDSYHILVSENAVLNTLTSLTVDEGHFEHFADNLDLTQIHTLSVFECSHDTVSDNISLSGVVALEISESYHDISTDPTSLVQIHNVVIAECYHENIVDSPVLTQSHELAVNDSDSEHAADGISLTQDHTLVISESYSEHAADNIVLITQGSLSVAETHHLHEADSPTLTQAHNLAIQESHSEHFADGISIVQLHDLLVEESYHLHDGDNLILNVSTTLVIADAYSEHYGDNVALGQLHSLTVQEAYSDHVADNVSLGGTVNLVVDGCANAHFADNIILEVIYNISVFECYHDHAVDSVILTQICGLVIADAYHDISSDILTLVTPAILNISGAYHYHSADSITLTTDNALPATLENTRIVSLTPRRKLISMTPIRRLAA